MTITHLNETTENEMAEVLVGRRIVSAEMGSFPHRGGYGAAEGLLVLDDGTVLLLTGNDGGCSCGSGDYSLDRVAEVENVITSVRIESDPDSDYEQGEGVYRIFVFADSREINVAEFIGTDGNGYYGTGFSVTVIKPDESV